MLMSAEGMILRARMGDIREIGRNAQGVRLMDLPEDDRLVGVAKLAETDEGDTSGIPGEDSPEVPDSSPESGVQDDA
jgi:DNA gyrase subunit A